MTNTTCSGGVTDVYFPIMRLYAITPASGLTNRETTLAPGVRPSRRLIKIISTIWSLQEERINFFVYRLLTYMATITSVIGNGLELFELPHWEPRLPIKPLYVADGLFDWADDTAELHDKSLSIGGRTLFEHLFQAFCDFRCEERFHCGDLRRMMPTNKGVWSMHAPGLRIYGWCPAKHEFVAVTAAFEATTKKDRHLNNRKQEEVLSFAKRYRLSNTVLLGDILALFPHKN